MAAYYCTDTTELSAGAGADTALNITSNASTAHVIYLEEIHASFAASGDNVIVLTVGRTTDAGTGDSPTIEPINPVDRAAQGVAVGNCTGEPTYGDTVFEMDVYQRMGLIYKAPITRPFVGVAATTDGFGGKADHATLTSAYRVSMVWHE